MPLSFRLSLVFSPSDQVLRVKRVECQPRRGVPWRKQNRTDGVVCLDYETSTDVTGLGPSPPLPSPDFRSNGRHETNERLFPSKSLIVAPITQSDRPRSHSGLFEDSGV